MSPLEHIHGGPRDSKNHHLGSTSPFWKHPIQNKMTKHPRQHLLQKTRRFQVRNRISYKGKMKRKVKSSHKNWGLEMGKNEGMKGKEEEQDEEGPHRALCLPLYRDTKLFLSWERSKWKQADLCPMTELNSFPMNRKCVVKNPNVLLVIKGVKEHRWRNLPSCLSFGAQSPGWVTKITLPNVREMKSDPKQDSIFVPESANIKDIQIPPERMRLED